jgi:hypothetical protein
MYHQKRFSVVVSVVTCAIIGSVAGMAIGFGDAFKSSQEIRRGHIQRFQEIEAEYARFGEPIPNEVRELRAEPLDMLSFKDSVYIASQRPIPIAATSILGFFLGSFLGLAVGWTVRIVL